MLTEIPCHDSHYQLFDGDVCVCTVRAEYKDSVAIAIENQIAGTLAAVANSAHTPPR